MEKHKTLWNKGPLQERASWRWGGYFWAGMVGGLLGIFGSVAVDLMTPYYVYRLEGGDLFQNAFITAACSIAIVETYLRKTIKKPITCRINPLRMTIKNNCSAILEGEKLRGRE